MSLAWKLNRIRAMGMPELAFRGRALVLSEIRTLADLARVDARPHGTVQPGLALFDESDDWIERWQNAYKLDEPALRKIAAGHMSFFGYAPMDFGQPIDWHRDPSTGIVTPLVYGKEIDYRE